VRSKWVRRGEMGELGAAKERRSALVMCWRFERLERVRRGTGVLSKAAGIGVGRAGAGSSSSGRGRSRKNGRLFVLGGGSGSSRRWYTPISPSSESRISCCSAASLASSPSLAGCSNSPKSPPLVPEAGPSTPSSAPPIYPIRLCGRARRQRGRVRGFSCFIEQRGR
jgi:hypothetical protein